MRGKAKTTDESLQEDGITPAYAGKRPFAVNKAPAGWDHPRLCGEKHFFNFGLCRDVGITPAYAGKSVRGRRVRYGRRDHPRLCGEKDTVLDVTVFMPGSPPPMRGKAVYMCYVQLSLWITPAYAGKS